MYPRFTLGYYRRHYALFGVIVLKMRRALKGYFPRNSNATETLLESTSNSNVRAHPCTVAIVTFLLDFCSDLGLADMFVSSLQILLLFW